MMLEIGAIRCADGYITLGAANERLFRRLCEVLGRTEWTGEPAFADNASRVKNREALEKHYPDFLLKQVIRQCTKFAQASSEGIPIFAYDAESKGAQDIQAVLDEVQARVGAPVRLKAVESA